ncbi:mycothiol transferase [Knoellia koreensis]|uniref:DUF664 domain-containing protein n=1 Tax=Knoellia koreensis TaxID=2730921 RepID=A0A849HLC3_9MICO|nr:DUF664 domain-containing protein [Knoellia sp. DB2414S]NNM48218.1 DUF664 domain-containing protein [Knoellia sp. DB2414S]
MTLGELLVDSFTRIRDGAHDVVEGLTPQQLATRPTPRANSIAWLVWHLTRVQDDHIADVAGHEQVWTADGWADRFGLPFDAAETGYGMSADEVGQVTGLTAEQLTGYLDAVHDKTVAYVRDLSGDDLGRVVDERWDPPVTLGVRLVSIVNDDQQHVGQAAFVRGLIEDGAQR